MSDTRLALLDGLTRSVGLPPNFSGLSSTRKLEAILDMPHPERFLRSLRPDELFFLVQDIGVEDAIDLLAYATPEQRTVFCDLSVWDGAEFQPDRFWRFLDLLRGVSLDLALSFVARTDPELSALFLTSRCRIRPAAEIEGEETPDSFLTPDGVFLVLCDDPEAAREARGFLDLLYAVDVEFARRVLLGLDFDLPSSLDDASFRFRDARLQDFGFPAFDERTALWEPFDVASLKARIATRTAMAPGSAQSDKTLALNLPVTQTRLFFWEALAVLAGRRGIAGVIRAVLDLTNRVLAASCDDLSDVDAWKEAGVHALSLVSLGLEDLSGGDPERAADILGLAWPVELYRTGLEAIRPLHLRARAITAGVGGMGRLTLFEHESAETLRAAIRFPPLFWSGLAPSEAPEPRDFRATADVRLANRAMAETAAVLKFAREILGFCPDASPSITDSIVAPTFANVFATAWSRQVLSGHPSLEPLSGDEIRGLVIAAFDQGRIRPALRAALTSGAADAVPFLMRSLDRLEEALGRLSAGQAVDVRFVGDALLVRKS